MGDLEVDTRLDGGDGHWTVTLDPAWEIWGPCGGYIAALLLRAAGAHSAFPRPATLAVNFLGVAAFAPVDLHAETLQAGRRSQCVRVTMTQEGRPISHAVVWTMADPDGREGIAYDWTEHPVVAGPHDLKPMEELT
ncbi:MAG TPA: acyl-CoA thioesterase domain-containing protein, partial [Acidimicrobiales bacterium]